MIRVWKAIKWQIQAVFHEIRTAAAFFLVLNAVLLLLPLSACQIIDNMAGFAVVFISVCYAASLLMALFYGMNCMPEKPDARQNELWRLAEPNPWLRIFSRLTAVAVLMAVSFLNGQAGTSLMQKFADANHSYFRMEMNGRHPPRVPAVRCFPSAAVSFFDAVFPPKTERSWYGPYTDRGTDPWTDSIRHVKKPFPHSRHSGRDPACYLPVLADR